MDGRIGGVVKVKQRLEGSRLGRRLGSHGYSMQCKQRKGVAKPAQWSTTQRGRRGFLNWNSLINSNSSWGACAVAASCCCCHGTAPPPLRFPLPLAAFQPKRLRLTSDVETFSTQAKERLPPFSHSSGQNGRSLTGKAWYPIKNCSWTYNIFN